jgi:hypothetical protein
MIPIIGTSILQHGRVGSFNPLSLSPSLWFDFSDLTTLFQDTGGTSPVTTTGQSIARINDKSGNARHATQATPAAMPTYSTSSTINGRAIGSFDGGDRLGTSAVDLTATNKLELWGVAQSTTTTNDQHLWGNRNASAGSIVLTHSSGTNFPYAYAQGNVGATQIFGAINSAASIRRGVCDFSLSTDEINLYVDGTLQTGSRPSNNNNSGNFGNLSWWIGARSDGAAPFTGRVGELFAFNRLLTTAEASALSVYLKARWGTP